ncbi:DUF4340 domain-containing protein [Celerinatantimonas diazotrophica]|uniref:Uncharacterized protein DUF4340 n=1 Tax=Celerinatantimonas diazotrophica TaxID=412034 RepID=A0A4R1K5R5_9GAMM|nr:DUF4340 domain-containing protein [Celerinatantimonas diazotrophica]TCK59093.1 uncharacterized protein DUF4340 [Celerinatantimonas diazotrophica]CAG9297731.1 hypothetical protein CEDIAZO_02920 [Celerinatantimonas diazotrophica]
MFRKITISLVALLVIQGAVCAGFWIHANHLRQQAQTRSLFKFDNEKVVSLSVQSAKKQLTLTQVNGKWQLPELDNLPADRSRITNLLSQLHQIKVDWPIATSQNAQKRFKVAKDDFKRHIIIKTKTKTVADFYLGSEPNYHQRNLRRAGDQAIYQVHLATSSLPIDAPQWFDKTLLATSSDAIKGPSFSLIKHKQIWQNGSKNSHLKEVVDQIKAAELADALSNLNVQTVAKIPIKASPERVLNVSSGKHHYRYQLYHQGKRYQISRNDYKQRFVINQGQYTQLLKITANNLFHPVKAKAKGQEKTSANK